MHCKTTSVIISTCDNSEVALQMDHDGLSYLEFSFIFFLPFKISHVLRKVNKPQRIEFHLLNE